MGLSSGWMLPWRGGVKRKWTTSKLVAVVAVTAVAPGVGLGATPDPAAAAKPKEAAAATPTGSVERPDAESALAVARKTTRRVEVSGLRSMTGQVFANGDGTFTSVEYAVPQRVHKDGAWRKIDTTLRRAADGSVAPVAAVSDVRFSGGGTAPLIKLRTADGGELSLSWSTPLPSPVLAGDLATYPEVLPGVDLQVRAQIDGFAQVLKVKNRAAAANPALRKVSLGVAARGGLGMVEREGVVEIRDRDGNAVMSSQASFMWDSPPTDTPAGSGARGRAEPADPDRPPAHEVEMPVDVSPAALAVTPDPAMLAGDDVVFPLYIDPPFTGRTNKWTIVNRSAPGTSYWNSSGYRDTMRVGKQWQAAAVWRSLMEINTATIRKTQIIKASFFVTLDHSADCAPSPVQLWKTGPIGPGSTWNNTKGGWSAFLQERNGSANEGACPKPDQLMEFGDVKVKNTIQANANANAASLTFGLKAKSESNDYQWKKFIPNSAHIQVTFNRTPNAPNTQQITDCYTRCASPAYVSVKNPQLKVKASDPDGGTLTVRFEVQNSAGAAVRSGSVTGYPSGSAAPAAWRITPALSADGWYKWRARACDAYVCGAYTGWFTFTADSVPPAAPPTVAPVDPTLYFEDDGSGESSGGIGVPGKLTLGANGQTDVAHYVWWLGGDSPTRTTAPTPGGVAEVTITPKADLIQVFSVYSLDLAGRQSVTETYTINVRPPEPEAGSWLLDESGTDPAAVDELGRHNGTSTGGVTRVAGRSVTSGNAAHFTGSGAIATALPVLTTSRSFSVSGWVHPSDVSTARTMVSQRGAQKTAFELGYQTGGANTMCFSLFSADSTAAAATRACATRPYTPGRWVHLAGVYDDVERTITLYVGGGTELGGETVVVPYTGGWTSTGPLAIGTGWHGGTPMAHWVGDVDEVHAYQRTLSLEEVQSQALDGPDD